MKSEQGPGGSDDLGFEGKGGLPPMASSGQRGCYEAFPMKRALAEAHKSGCVFRLAGAGVAVRGLVLPKPPGHALAAHNAYS